MNVTLFSLQTCLFAAGLMINSYEFNARRMGWPIGEWFFGGSWLCIVGGFGMLFALIGSVIVNPWWSFFCALLLGFVTGSLMPMFLKKHTQFVSTLMLVSSWILLSL